MTKTPTRALPIKDDAPARSFALHSIFTHPFGHSRPVFDAPNEGGGANPPADPAPATLPADPATPPADPAAKPKPSDEEARLLKENMAFKKQLKQFEGIDLAEVQALQKAKADADAAAAAAEQEAALKRGEFDRVKAQMVEQHNAALAALQDQLAERDSQLAGLTSTVEDLTVGAKFAGSAYVNENLVLTDDIARTVFGAHFDVSGKDIVAYDKPRGAADRTPLTDAAGNPVGFDVALEKLVALHPKKDRLLRSKQVPGAGSTTIDKAPTAPKAPAALTGMARIAANLDKLKPLDVKL